MAIISSLNQILFPARCLICSTLGETLCPTCRLEWRFSAIERTFNHGGTSIKAISSLEYSPTIQKIVLAAKESEIAHADLLMQSALRHSINAAQKYGWIDALVTIPSRPSAVRRRGREFLIAITEDIASDLGVPLLNILSHTRRIKDQSGLYRQQRWNNLDGALVVKEKRFSGMRVLLVDDLVTTGATLVEGVRALSYAGIEVVRGVTASIAKPLR